MGYPAEQRDKLSTPLCGARKKCGTTCRAFAGQGTDHLGHGPCKYHGGATRSHRASAIRLEAKARMVKLGTPLDRIEPGEAISGLLRASAGHVNWLRESIIELRDLGTPEAAVLLRMYDSERDRLTRISEAAIKSGVAEAEVRLAEGRTLALVGLLRTAAADAGLNPRQVAALGAALHRALATSDVIEHDNPERAAEEALRAEARLTELRGQIAADEERRIEAEADRRARRLSGLTFPPDELVPPRQTAASHPRSAGA